MSDSLMPPDREPERTDWFLSKLGRSQQKVISLTVRNMDLHDRIQKLEALLDEHGIEEPDPGDDGNASPSAA